MTERDANQLAADERLETIRYELTKPVQSQFIRRDCEWLVGRVDELVGLVGTLQQERDDQYATRAQLEVESNANATAARDAQEALARSYVERREYADLTKAISDRATAAEARAEALQQERDAERRWCKHWAERAEAAEAALAEAQQERHEYGVWAEGKIADTRQALELLLEWAEKDRGGGYPEENRSEEWYTHRDFARRALADTGGDTKEPADFRVGYECAHKHRWWMAPNEAPRGCPVCNTITFGAVT